VGRSFLQNTRRDAFLLLALFRILDSTLTQFRDHAPSPNPGRLEALGNEPLDAKALQNYGCIPANISHYMKISMLAISE